MQTRITPEPGKIYLIRHSSGRIRARFLTTKRRFAVRYNPYRCRNGDEEILDVVPTARPERTNLHYVFLNIGTNREITLKSRAKIIAEVLA